MADNYGALRFGCTEEEAAERFHLGEVPAVQRCQGMKMLGLSHGGSNTRGPMEMHLAEKAPALSEARGVKREGCRRRC